jgi:hypothetical protein
METDDEVGGEGLTIRSASALRFSKGCSSLNLDRMVLVEFMLVRCVLSMLMLYLEVEGVEEMVL